ncbi:hypothetical protein D3C87_2066610 [compost metagenome]
MHVDEHSLPRIEMGEQFGKTGFKCRCGHIENDQVSPGDRVFQARHYRDGSGAALP